MRQSRKVGATAVNSTNHDTRFMKKDYSTRSIVFAASLDCSSSRTRNMIIKSAAVAALFTPVRLRLTSYSDKNNGVVCAHVRRKHAHHV
jgi:hypothetical protein